MNRYAFWLAVVLRVAGVTMLLALPAVFMPRGWMAATYEAMARDGFPPGPLVEVLARQLSAVYAVLGGLLLLISLDVARQARVVRYVGATSIGLGLVLGGAILHAGLPWWWALTDPVLAVLLGVVVLALQALAGRAAGGGLTAVR